MAGEGRRGGKPTAYVGTPHAPKIPQMWKKGGYAKGKEEHPRKESVASTGHSETHQG